MGNVGQTRDETRPSIKVGECMQRFEIGRGNFRAADMKDTVWVWKHGRKDGSQ